MTQNGNPIDLLIYLPCFMVVEQGWGANLIGALDASQLNYLFIY